jgi:hypothetical protein
MKRALLIATGTVGGLGAVLAVTPPQFTASENTMMALPDASTAVATTPSATASATQSAAAGKPSTPNATQPQTSAAAPAPVKTTAAPANNSASGTFTGDSVDVRY